MPKNKNQHQLHAPELGRKTDNAVGPRQKTAPKEPFAESLEELGDRLNREAMHYQGRAEDVKGGLVYSPQAILLAQDTVRLFAKFNTQVTDWTLS